jgi:glucose-1-phosphate thymidylyltransferase
MLEKMRLADVKKIYVILRKGKWDIPLYFGDGKMLDMHLAYLMMDLPFGVPFTLDQAYPFVKDATVALGFPDMIIQPDDAFDKLLAKQDESNADIVLGLFPADQPHKTDMVEMDDHGRIRAIYIKPEQTHLVYAWEIAVWSPAFTAFMHNYVLSQQERYTKVKNNIDYEKNKELFVGDIIQEAIRDNMKVDVVVFKDGKSLDIGDPDDLLKATKITLQLLKDL